ncbi:MAG TPA: sodium:solute symporter family protein [Bacteroidales bacterium]|nr:sodium:solute symporter family protein [Bacteroidales bacterium]
MHPLDLIIFISYIIAMLGIGVWFHIRNKNIDDFYVGGREMGSWHVGFSVVATDVGGGFSIGLGGLGFAIGLSGSWMLFTGLLGAWLSAVFLIPKIKVLSDRKNLYTFPQIFQSFYDHRVAMVAGIISAIGYLGFTSSQLLAGAKLASATFQDLNLQNALILMGVVAVGYTVLGGLKAVIYTDTLQWIILLAGLIFIGIPIAFIKTGGFQTLVSTLDPDFLSLANISPVTFINWLVTILPIWFVGMTLYQRIYASRSVKQAQKAWYIAGLFEWPVMAFMGVLLGLFARVAYENGMFADIGLPAGAAMDPEMGLPLLLRHILPFGLMGLLLSAYFSAILSTADSCLIAASGNILTDILEKIFPGRITEKRGLLYSKVLTLIVGIIAIGIALRMEGVLQLMLYSYAIMVSGLFIPVVALLVFKRPNTNAALVAMIAGGTTTIVLSFVENRLPYGLAANIFGISLALTLYLAIHYYKTLKHKII